MGMKMLEAVGLWEGGPLPELSELQLTEYLLACGKWAYEINLFAALMQKGSENGTQEI